MLVVAMVVFIPAATGLRIVTFPRTIEVGKYDCAIVLGAAVSNNWPTPVFQARLDHGVQLYRQGIVDILIFTGGVGSGDVRAESEVGAAYAAAQGISPGDLLVEKTSETTPQNLLEAQKLMTAAGLGTTVIVSDPLHLYRSSLIAHSLGMDASSSATPTTRYRSWRTKLPFLLREIYFTLRWRVFKHDA